MQRSAFIITLFSLFTFFSLALASPLHVQAVREIRESAVKLSAHEIPGHKIFDREAATHTESDTNLHILAQEHETFKDHVQEVTGKANIAGRTQDLELRQCRGAICV